MQKIKLPNKIARKFNDSSVKYIINKLCGEYLGCGTYRNVWVLKDDPRFVVKIEKYDGRGDFANVMEWRNYINNADFKAFCKWLAPCHLINFDGRVLVQERIEFKKKKHYPKKIPSWFTDVKIQNYGWIGENFVCCDYVYLRPCDYKMRNVKWRNDSLS